MRAIALALLAGAAVAVSRQESQQFLGTDLEATYGAPQTKSSVLSKPLGASTGTLSDERFTASSTYRAPKSAFSAWLGRMNAKPSSPSAGAWRAAVDRTGEWLQVDLGRNMELTGIAIQGQAFGDAYVTRFKLQHSKDGFSWKSYPNEFKGVDGDADSVKLVDLTQPLLARYVRVLPTAWHRHIAMRIELYGYSPECGALEEEKVVGVPCAKAAKELLEAAMGAGKGEANLDGGIDRHYSKGFPLGLGAGLLSDAAFTASSEYKPKKFFAGTDDEERCRGIHKALRAMEKEAEQPKKEAADKEVDEEGSGKEESASFLELEEEALRLDAEAEAEAEDAALEQALEAEAMEMDLDNDSEAEADSENETESDSESGKRKVISGVPPCGIKTSFAARYARLNAHPQPYRSGGWRPSVDKVGQWLQLDLGSLMEVDAVSTQGMANAPRWVTAFDLFYSSNGRVWEKAMPAATGTGGSFEGNTDSSTPVKSVLSKPLLTRYLRFVVRDFNQAKNGGIGMRVEAYGPGKGSGCLLRCFAANLAKNTGGRDLDAALSSVNTANDAIFTHALPKHAAALPDARPKEGKKVEESSKDEPSFLEVEAEAGKADMEAEMDMEMAAEASASSTVEMLAELAVQADAQVSKLVSCCGCPCCESVDPGSCSRRFAGKSGSKGRKSNRKGSLSKAGNDEDISVASDAAKAVLRGKKADAGSSSERAYSSPHARKVAAEKKVAATVTVPSGRKFLVVEAEEEGKK